MLQEVGIGPVAPRRGLLGIRHVGADQLFRGEVFLLRRVHQLAVGLVVPPHETQVAVHDVGAGMNVAGDALAAGNGERELVADRMAGAVLGNGRVGRKARALVAEAGIRPRMHGRAVVGVDHVAAAATAGAVVAGVVIGAEEIQRRIEQAGLLQPQKNRVGAIFRAQTAIAEAGAGPAGIVFGFRDARFRAKPPAALEDTQDVARLGDLKPRQRVEIGELGLALDCLDRRRRNGLDPLRHAVHAVALAIPRLLVGHSAIVVEGGAPEHAAVRHHALPHGKRFRRMAIAAGRLGDAQIARIEEADELGRLVIQQGVRPDRVARGRPVLREAGMDVGLFSGRCAGIAAVAIGASESHDGLAIDPLGMHVADVGVAQHAALALGRRVGFRLPQQVVRRGAWQYRAGRRAILRRRCCGHVSQQSGKGDDQQTGATDTQPNAQARRPARMPNRSLACASG